MSLISYLTRIHFADDVLEEAVNLELSAHKVRRPLIVTDEGIVATGLIQRLYDALDRGSDHVTFSDVPANPDEAACRAAADVYREHDCDGIIAFGGGSPIDLAKATALILTHAGQIGRAHV